MADELSGTSAMGDGGGASADISAPPPVAAEAPPAGGGAPEGGSQEAPPAAPHKDLIDEIDNLGTDAEPAEKPKTSSTTTQKDESAKAAPDLSKSADAEKAVKPTGDSTQSEDGKAETPSGDEAATIEGDEAKADEPEIPDADWNAIPKDVDDHIKQSIPKADQQLVRKHYKEGAMLRSFMNPNTPPSVVVENLEKKSGMRYAAIEGEILKRNLAEDPVQLLAKAYEATADPDTGNSEAYQRLLDATIETNKDYVLHVLKTKHNLDLAAANGNGNATSEASTGTTDLKDEDIDGIANSTAFQQLQDSFPEEAEKLSALLTTTKELKAKEAERAAQEAAAKAAEADQGKEAETQATRDQLVRQTNDFTEVYGANVTTPINTKLDKDYGLEVTAEEKEKQPMMALLKSAKKQLILSGGLENAQDFDNALYEWGQSRPAFKAAAKAMVEFTKAGEKDNAAAAAKDLAGFAEMFLAERLKNTPELKLVDDLIQMVARSQKANLDKREDLGGAAYTNGNSRTGGPNRGFLAEIDDL